MGKICISSHGYQVVTINGKTKYVHRLIAEEHIPNPLNKPQVNHKNGIKTDNRIENLEWVTIKENFEHARKNGLWGKNILDKRKLTDEQIKEIKLKYIPRKYTIRTLAKEYNVDYRTIWDIVNLKSYQNV
jgi:hypothetical protein